jgi:hypothetical protein
MDALSTKKRTGSTPPSMGVCTWATTRITPGTPVRPSGEVIRIVVASDGWASTTAPHKTAASAALARTWRRADIS